MALEQLLHVLRVHIGVALQKQTASFKVSVHSRQMQWSAFVLRVLRVHIGLALDQKTAKCKVSTPSRQMQWSFLTEEKQKIQLAQAEFPINPIIKKMMR